MWRTAKQNAIRWQTVLDLTGTEARGQSCAVTFTSIHLGRRGQHLELISTESPPECALGQEQATAIARVVSMAQ